MEPSSFPDGMPILSRGRHRSPRSGACFMELASVLAGERWGDHPTCTHPLLGQLARQVNDNISDDGRQDLTLLIPAVVGRRGTDQTWITVSVAVAATVILDVPEPAQRALAGGLLQAEQLCVAADPELVASRREARQALDLVPGAVAWVERLGVRGRVDAKAFAKHCAPTIVRCAVEGVVASERPDADRLLRALLEAGIAACPAPETHVAAPEETPAATTPVTVGLPVRR